MVVSVPDNVDVSIISSGTKLNNPSKRKNRVVVSANIFLETYIDLVKQGKSFEDLAEHFNLSHQGAYQKFRNLSEKLKLKGINLPKMRISAHPKTKENIDELVLLAKSKLGDMTTIWTDA